MRMCVVFRGENLRQRRGLTSALECIDNWKEAILDVIPCDVVFFTYPSEILEELIARLSPIHVCTSGYDSQESNALAAINWMTENQDQYDRFVLLRFDIMYRKRITEWPHWDTKGIILVNRDVHYPILQLYADIVFIIDCKWTTHFKDAFVGETKYKCSLHHIGKYLENMSDVPFHLMYQKYYHMMKHPLHALHPLEHRPNLDDDYEGEEIIDISPWNPVMNPNPPQINTQQRQTKPNVKTRTRRCVIFKNKI